MINPGGALSAFSHLIRSCDKGHSHAAEGDEKLCAHRLLFHLEIPRGGAPG